MKIEAHVTDSSKEQSGVWMEFDNDTKFLIGSMNSMAYRKCYQRKLKAQRIKTKNPTEEQVDEMIRSCYAETILLGWKGITKDGIEFPYSVENSIWILSNCPNIREYVFFAAQNNDNFRKEQLEEAKAAAGES